MTSAVGAGPRPRPSTALIINPAHGGGDLQVQSSLSPAKTCQLGGGHHPVGRPRLSVALDYWRGGGGGERGCGDGWGVGFCHCRSWDSSRERRPARASTTSGSRSRWPSRIRIRTGPCRISSPCCVLILVRTGLSWLLLCPCDP